MLKVNYKNLLSKKNLEPITCLTAYSKPLANLLDGRVDIILIGDSLGTTLYGIKNTRNVTLEMMKNLGFKEGDVLLGQDFFRLPEDGPGEA